MTVSRRELHEGWTLTVTDGPIPFPVRDLPATVPGTFLTDLLDAGLIPDPYLDRNEHELAWSGECDLLYRTVFQIDELPSGRTDLVAGSLDTAATVMLNGAEVATVQNQHRSWRFPVESLLRTGANTLEIRFASPLRTARENAAAQGDLPVVGNDLPYNAIRKMACNFGWDWGPVLVTSGIAGPIALESWSGARLDRVRPLVVPDADGPGGTVALTVPVEREHGADGPLHLRLEVTGPGGDLAGTAEAVVPAGASQAEVSLHLESVELWWPRGHGEQPLYTARVVLEDAAGGGDPSAAAPLDAVSHRIAFRTAGVVEEPDEVGTSFTVVVNDRPVLVKGANWIPDDCFPTRLTAEDYARGVGHAVDAGMNMLRIWGGGLYAAEELYDLCDELGVMVWQDVAMACAAYSEEEPLRGEIEEELREHAVRLAWHPSLVHWNGSNENVEGYFHWGWKDVIEEGVGWGNRYYTEIFPAILSELDPTRSYTPSSPYSRGVLEQPRHPDHGTVHNWVVWASEEDNDYVHYRDTDPPLRGRVRLPGPRYMGDGGARDLGAPAARRLPHDALAPEGGARAGEARGRVPAALPRPGPRELRGLPPHHCAEPGTGAAGGDRALPLPVAALHGHDHLAAQRLLARDLVGGGRRGRPPEAALVRDEGPLRPTPAHRRAAPRRPRRRARQRHRRSARRHPVPAPGAPRRRDPRGGAPDRAGCAAQHLADPAAGVGRVPGGSEP